MFSQRCCKPCLLSHIMQGSGAFGFRIRAPVRDTTSRGSRRHCMSSAGPASKMATGALTIPLRTFCYPPIFCVVHFPLRAAKTVSRALFLFLHELVFYPLSLNLPPSPLNLPSTNKRGQFPVWQPPAARLAAGSGGQCGNRPDSKRGSWQQTASELELPVARLAAGRRAVRQPLIGSWKR